MSTKAPQKILEKETKPGVSPEELKLRYFEARVDLAKGIAWPVFALIVFVIVSYPLVQTLNKLPDRFSQLSKLSVGDLSFEIQLLASQQGLEELGKTIGELSPEAVEVLLNRGAGRMRLIGESADPTLGKTYYSLPNEYTMNALYELETKKLLEFTIPMQEYYELMGRLGLEKIPNEYKPYLNQYVATRMLTDDELKLLKSQDYYLSELGINAFEIITKAVTEQFTIK
jgi:hypothetical protein